ncbi:MAG: M48 family metallopeptidase [Burkholderiales bacterium]|nr:M48 family metallopeptidase [Burkholderiales bacterium]
MPSVTVCNSRRRWMRLAAAAAAALVAATTVAGCKSTTAAGTVGVERKQTLLLSSREVNNAAAQSYQQILAQASRKGLLNRDPQQVARVRAVAKRLIPVTAAFRQDAPGWQWEVNVITLKDLNAWCMPGGKIAVYTGLLEKLQLTDDELAAVMGHEIAHALREHGRERASQAVATGAVIGIAGAVLGASSGAVDLAGIVADLTISRPNSRTHEIEADRIGVELAARAGYDPRAAVSVWQKMARAGDGEPPQFLSTHPSTENRIRDLQSYAARVEPLYQQARKR